MVAVLGLRGRARREGFEKRLWVGGGEEDQRSQEGRVASGDTLSGEESSSSRARAIQTSRSVHQDWGAVTGRVGLDWTGRGLRLGLVVLTGLDLFWSDWRLAEQLQLL